MGKTIEHKFGQTIVTHEADCIKCVACNGNRCVHYGDDPNKAAEQCMADHFKHYIERGTAPF